eukprot:scpid75024/ scgid4547/ 
MAPPTERRKKAVKRRTAKKRDVSTKRSSKRCTTSFSSHHPRAPSSHETLGPCREIPRAVSNACACRDSASPDIRPDETMEDGEQRVAGKSSMSLQWVKPPIKTYRARYKNELSKRGNCRGALEDETGDAWPVVKLTGYGEREAVHLDVSATTSDGQSHPLFFCKTAGRDAPTSCHGVPLSDGSQALRFVLRPEQENICDLKHIGVVRLQREAGGDSGRLGLAASQTNYFNLTVTAHIPHQSTPVTLQSGAIKCISSTQAVSKPVVTQVLQLADHSAAGASVKVLAMGKDFLPSTHFRVFQQRADKSVWQVTIPPEECVVHCTHNCVIQFTMPQPPSDVIRMGPSKDLKVFIDAGSNTTRRSISSVPLSEERAFLFQYPIASAFHGKSSNRTASLPITSVSPMTSPMTSQPPSTVNDYTKSFTSKSEKQIMTDIQIQNQYRIGSLSASIKQDLNCNYCSKSGPMRNASRVPIYAGMNICQSIDPTPPSDQVHSPQRAKDELVMRR